VRPVPLESGWQREPLYTLLAGLAFFTIVYAVVYPIYRGVWLLATRGASKGHAVARTAWYLTLGALVMFIIGLPLVSVL